MKPPPPPSATAPINSLSSTSAAMSLGSYGGAAGGRILPNVERSSSHSMMMSSSVASTDYFSGGDDKKQIKRAANRRSAQLSRKRKKQFIEELKEENDDLRRKEQILRAIPDLIVVFDSSGKLGFVSESVGRFIDMSPEELEGTSFWDRLCEDSVRLLKAAFMDSLAARKPDSETAQLGSGVWELRLVDKDSNYMIVTLNGVVHFKGDVPECVCCIRPREQDLIQKLGGTSGGSTANGTGKQAKTSARAVSSSDGSRTSDGSSGKDEPRVRVNPRQSVVGNETSVAEEEERAAARKRRRRAAEGENGTNEEGQIVRISDGDSIEVSESGSDDGVASS
jgi:PAS domain-containing protein